MKKYSKIIFIALLFLCVQVSNAGPYQDAAEKLGYTELAATFSAEKVAILLNTKIDQVSNNALAEAQAQAVLVVLGAPLAEPELSRFIANYKKTDYAYVGNIGEASLYQRINTLWQTTEHQPRSPFAISLRNLIKLGVANGYNIATSPWPQFDPERQLVYGHNDIHHAQQLLALMASEGITARVGFSLKTSAYMHRDGWGPVPTNAVPLGDNRFLIEAQEYNLHFEFPSSADKQRFMALINRYSKQYEGQRGPLIYGAWWQPFYRSFAPADGFNEVTQVQISNAGETAVVIVTPDKADTLKKDIAKLKQDWTIVSVNVWVNPAFYRYLGGGFQ